MPGAAVLVIEEWLYPEDDDTTRTSEEDSDGQDDGRTRTPSPSSSTSRCGSSPTAPRPAGFTVPSRPTTSAAAGDEESVAEAEAPAAEERRRVIANNKAWTSAETVRRRFITGLLGRKTPPKGAEALICEAVVTGQHSLYKAMEGNTPDAAQAARRRGGQDPLELPLRSATIAGRATTPKAATITTLAAVLAAWEDSIGKHTWRNPNDWDDRVLSALIEWGYEPSEVESLLLDEEPRASRPMPPTTPATRPATAPPDRSSPPPEVGSSRQPEGRP